MAVKMGGAMQTGGGSRFRRRVYTPMSEINVTPFVDVMLVLLIVFMISAPLLNVGINVDLPKITADPVTSQQQPVVITVDKSGALFIGQDSETKYDVEELVAKLKAISKERTEERIFVRADQTVNYGRVMEAFSAIRNAGFTKAALVADMSGGGKPAAPGAAPKAAAPAAPSTPARKN